MKNYISIIIFVFPLFCFQNTYSSQFEVTTNKSTIEKPVEYTSEVSTQEWLNDDLSKTTFTNGLTLIVHERPSTQTVAAEIFLKAGSIFDPEGKEGLAHLLEHIIFGDWRLYGFMCSGSDVNGRTDYEFTEYYMKIVSSVLWENCLRSFVNMIFSPLGEIDFSKMDEKIETDSFKKEKKIIIQEMNGINDNPVAEIMYTAKSRMLNKDDILGREVIGSPKSLKKITWKDLLAFYLTYYRPENTIFVVVGDIKLEDVIAIIKDEFRMDDFQIPGLVKLERPDLKKREMDSRLSEKRKRQIKTSIKPYFIFNVVVTDGEQMTGNDIFTLNLINSILVNKTNGRLNNVIDEDLGISQEIFSWVEGYSDIGFLTTIATFKDEMSGGDLIEIIPREFERLKVEPISEKELKTHKRIFTNNYFIDHETNEELAYLYGRSELYGSLLTIEQRIECINQVSADDIQRLANKYFQQKNSYLFMSEPMGFFDSLLRYIF